MVEIGNEHLLLILDLVIAVFKYSKPKHLNQNQ